MGSPLSRIFTIATMTFPRPASGFRILVSRIGSSDFIWDFKMLLFPSHLGKYFIKVGKISAKIHENGKIMAIFGLGMTPI